MCRTSAFWSSWRLACSCVSISIRLVRSRFFSPYARGLIEARIGLMNPSSGEVVSGMSAGRVQRGARRPNWSATIARCCSASRSGG